MWILLLVIAVALWAAWVAWAVTRNNDSNTQISIDDAWPFPQDKP